MKEIDLPDKLFGLGAGEVKVTPIRHGIRAHVITTKSKGMAVRLSDLQELKEELQADEVIIREYCRKENSAELHIFFKGDSGGD